MGHNQNIDDLALKAKFGNEVARDEYGISVRTLNR
jgi:hypothetical protein